MLRAVSVEEKLNFFKTVLFKWPTFSMKYFHVFFTNMLVGPTICNLSKKDGINQQNLNPKATQHTQTCASH